MEFDLDRDVISRDGQKVGTVDRVAIHPDTLEIEALIVHEGIVFTNDRIVETEMVDHVDGEGNIHLRITKDQEEELPRFVKRRYVEPSQGQYARLSDMQQLTLPSAAGRVLVMSEPTNADLAPAPDTPFQPAPSDAPTIEDQTNIREDTVTINEGTEVVDTYGEKLGTVDDIVYGSGGRIEAIVVESGFFFRHHVRIPAAWFDSVTHDRIKIDRSAGEAERAGKID